MLLDKSSINTKLFFELVRAGLWAAEAQIRSYHEVDYATLMQLSVDQSLVGLVAAGLEQVTDVQVPQGDALRFITQTLQIEQRNKAMNTFIASLVEKMRAADINTLLLVKGQGIAQCYEKPLWRVCGDVDFFLREDDYTKAKEILLPIASSVEEEFVREKHLGMTIDGWVVELHGHLYCGLSSRVERELDRLQEDTFYGGQVRSWMNGKTEVFLLKEENDAFYVFTHILQHFYKGGIGMRQICDWCRLLYTYKNSLNHELLKKRIERAGLMMEWKAFGVLAVEYLGMPVEAMPFYSFSAKLRKKAKRIMEFVLMSGNFGHNRDSNYMNYQYFIRKCFSVGRRINDLFHHARIFPLDSLRFSFAIMSNGVRSAMRGE